MSDSGFGRILVVEDERLVALDLVATLRDLGYDIAGSVSTGEEAIVKSADADLVLMDIRLAGKLDGVEAATAIRQKRDVPIIYLTAHSDDETLRRATATDPLGYLVKPVRTAELRCAIEIALHKHEIDQKLRDREEWLTQTLTSIGGSVDAKHRTDEEERVFNEELERRVVERTAQLEAANRELEAFSYSVAHDLRSPLRGIDGFSHLLIEKHAANLGPEGVEHLKRVRGAGQRMARLVEDLLRLARVAKSEFHVHRVKLSQLAKVIKAELRVTDPARQVEFVMADDLVVEGDENLLRIALENLLRNAWKFTSKTAQAKIEFGTKDIEAERVYYIRDNGAGFNMEHAGKLFAPFQRLHSNDDFEGTGVGLTIVQRIIQRHHGRIWADGSVGAGATFYFTLGDRADAR